MKNILLGVTGSVAAIKVTDLVNSLLTFANIRIVTTLSGEYFLKSQMDTLRALNIDIYRDDDEWPKISGHYEIGNPILHIELRRWADLLLVAPLDANTLAKITHGFCDNLLTNTIRAWDWSKPFVVCPAMNTMMWNNAPTQEQINLLKNRGGIIINPVEKKLACNDVGMGAMAVVENISTILSGIIKG